MKTKKKDGGEEKQPKAHIILPRLNLLVCAYVGSTSRAMQLITAFNNSSTSLTAVKLHFLKTR